MGTVVVYETTNYLPYYLTYASLPTELLFFVSRALRTWNDDDDDEW